MKILLLGGAGFIGSYLSFELTSRGHEVTVVDNLERDPDVSEDEFKKIFEIKNQTLLKGVYFHESEISKWIEGHGFEEYDRVVHLAALPIEKFEDKDVCRRQILEDLPLTFKIVEKMKETNPTNRIVFMSSLFAYGSFDWSANEDQPLKPVTAYGIGKATGEFIIKMSGLPYNIIRTTSVYGFGDQHLRATKIFLNRAMKGQAFWVNANAWPDFIYIKDLARGISDVLESDKNNQDFHISGGMCLPLEEFALKLKKYFPNINYELKDFNDRPRRGSLDNSKARVLLNWQPHYSLDEGIKEYIEISREYGFA